MSATVYYFYGVPIKKFDPHTTKVVPCEKIDNDYNYLQKQIVADTILSEITSKFNIPETASYQLVNNEFTVCDGPLSSRAFCEMYANLYSRLGFKTECIPFEEDGIFVSGLLLTKNKL